MACLIGAMLKIKIKSISNQSLGIWGEIRAGVYFLFHGYKIIAWRYKCKCGEIDIIATKANCLVFVEVKYRFKKHNNYPFAIDAVNISKQNKIKKTAQWFLLKKHKFSEHDIRYDVVTIDSCGFHHYTDAFQ